MEMFFGLLLSCSLVSVLLFSMLNAIRKSKMRKVRDKVIPEIKKSFTYRNIKTFLSIHQKLCQYDDKTCPEIMLKRDFNDSDKPYLVMRLVQDKIYFGDEDDWKRKLGYLDDSTVESEKISMKYFFNNFSQVPLTEDEKNMIYYYKEHYYPIGDTYFYIQIPIGHLITSYKEWLGTFRYDYKEWDGYAWRALMDLIKLEYPQYTFGKGCFARLNRR